MAKTYLNDEDKGIILERSGFSLMSITIFTGVIGYFIYVFSEEGYPIVLLMSQISVGLCVIAAILVLISFQYLGSSHSTAQMRNHYANHDMTDNGTYASIVYYLSRPVYFLIQPLELFIYLWKFFAADPGDTINEPRFQLFFASLVSMTITAITAQSLMPLNEDPQGLPLNYLISSIWLLPAITVGIVGLMSKPSL